MTSSATRLDRATKPQIRKSELQGRQEKQQPLDSVLPPEVLANLVRALQQLSQDGRDATACLCKWAKAYVANASLDTAVQRIVSSGGPLVD